jgi:hypothetical protein
MMSREEVVDWVAIRYGARHAEARTVDGDFVFWVSTQPDAYHDGERAAMTYGNGPELVVKSTGEVWRLASDPGSMRLYDARSEAELKQLMREVGYDPDAPDTVIDKSRVALPDPAPHEVELQHLGRWLASFGWREPACRITDLRFAFVVEPSPAIPNSNGPIVVVKRTAGVWFLGTSPAVWKATHQTRTETEFYAALQWVDPQVDPRSPHDRVPPGFAGPHR